MGDVSALANIVPFSIIKMHYISKIQPFNYLLKEL